MNKMPVLFIGHGSPMNAIAQNDYTLALQNLSQKIPNPKAILCVSAHWNTQGTWVTHMQNPKTIHDFYGFPKELFQVQYPALGSPELAEQIKNIVTKTGVNLDDDEWGLDHGTWSVLRHIYPQADIPVVQLSLDLSQKPHFHYELAKELAVLRQEGVLILGSGDVVHNLSRIQWKTTAAAWDWATEFDSWVKACLLNGQWDLLVNHFRDTEAGKLSVPTVEHYLPLIYCLGAAGEKEKMEFVFEGIQNASISMMSVKWG